MSNKWEETINENYYPLEFKIELKEGSDIIVWKTSIGGVNASCQSNGNFEEQTTDPYALSIWGKEQFLPMLYFLKDHEEELQEYVDRFGGK